MRPVGAQQRVNLCPNTASVAAVPGPCGPSIAGRYGTAIATQAPHGRKGPTNSTSYSRLVLYPSWVSLSLYPSFSPYSPVVSAELTQNPFASTHSLDANPFDDPPNKSSSSIPNDTRLEQLNQRERDLERREQELHTKVEHIRTHGRNNWPFC